LHCQLVAPLLQLPRLDALPISFQVCVDWSPFPAERHRLVCVGIADLGVDDILPEVHPGTMAAFAVCHPWRHLGHATHIDTSPARSEAHTSELQSRVDLVCRLLL